MKYYTIAECGINHLGNMDVAHVMVEAASVAGADFVKFQYYDPAELLTPQAKIYSPVIAEQVRKSMLTLGQLKELRDHAHKAGLLFMTTPFKTVRRIAEACAIYPDALKIRFADGPSNSPDSRGLAERASEIAAENKVPLVCCSVSITPIDSPGLMYRPNIRWMYCIPKYPPKEEDFNAPLTTGMKGISDHYPHITASLLAASLTRFDEYFIEKHVMLGPDTLATNESLPDYPVSIDFSTFQTLVQHLKLLERLKPHEKQWYPTINRQVVAE